VALDLRLYVRHTIAHLQERVDALIRALASLAEQHLDTVMRGTPISSRRNPFSSPITSSPTWRCSERDAGRLADCLKRTDVLPLGCGALAGTTFPIDRHFVARLLGFPEVSQNSLDTVGDRDFVAEFLATGAILACT